MLSPRRAERAGRRRPLAPWMGVVPLALAGMLCPSEALAQTPAPAMSGFEITLGLTLVPFVLVLTTSFIKFSVVLTFLRSALGVQQVLSGFIITALATLLSIYVMAPVGLDMSRAAEAQPELLDLRDPAAALESGAFDEVAAPLRTWLLRHSGPDELALFVDMATELHGQRYAEHFQRQSPLVMVPAFVLTELKEAFIIGFIILLPFLVVDLVVSNVLLSLGMHMMSPTTISLPFKLLLFVLIDGWSLIVHGLVMGYG